MDLLKQLTDEFLHIFDRCPSRLKSKMKSISASAQAQAQVRIVLNSNIYLFIIYYILTGGYKTIDAIFFICVE